MGRYRALYSPYAPTKGCLLSKLLGDRGQRCGLGTKRDEAHPSSGYSGLFFSCSNIESTARMSEKSLSLPVGSLLPNDALPPLLAHHPRLSRAMVRCSLLSSQRLSALIGSGRSDWISIGWSGHKVYPGTWSPLMQHNAGINAEAHEVILEAWMWRTPRIWWLRRCRMNIAIGQYEGIMK